MGRRGRADNPRRGGPAVTPTPVRIALIGLGGMGSAHAEIFAGMPHVHIAAVADPHAPFADRASAEITDAAVFYDPIDCANTADVDAVVVASADDTHFDIVQACIARGLPVLCEKPLTTTARQSRQIVDAERAAGRPLVQVGWMRRFDAAYQTLSKALGEEGSGSAVLISQRHRNPLSVIKFDERELITSSASHDIDVFRWLSGDEIITVSAVSRTSPDGNTVLVVLTLVSQTGTLGVMELVRGPGLSYDIACDLVTTAGAITLAPSKPNAADLLHTSAEAWMQRFAPAYRAQNAAWVAAVSEGTNVVGASAYDGYAVNTVIDAALASLDSGRAEHVELRAAP
jgi:myo-inositol 2-dehydrogenase/D-chiro-inositol 1-dehydrogenase